MSQSRFQRLEKILHQTTPLPTALVQLVADASRELWSLPLTKYDEQPGKYHFNATKTHLALEKRHYIEGTETFLVDLRNGHQISLGHRVKLRGWRENTLLVLAETECSHQSKIGILYDLRGERLGTLNYHDCSNSRGYWTQTLHNVEWDIEGRIVADYADYDDYWEGFGEEPKEYVEYWKIVSGPKLVSVQKEWANNPFREPIPLLNWDPVFRLVVKEDSHSPGFWRSPDRLIAEKEGVISLVWKGENILLYRGTCPMLVVDLVGHLLVILEMYKGSTSDLFRVIDVGDLLPTDPSF